MEAYAIFIKDPSVLGGERKFLETKYSKKFRDAFGYCIAEWLDITRIYLPHRFEPVNAEYFLENTFLLDNC